MINEKRLRLMTKMALYEKENRTELEKVRTYFRSDYIGVHLVKNGFRITGVFLVGLLAWGCYHMDNLIKEITRMDIGTLIFKILFVYLSVLCIYLVITYAIYAVRYAASLEGYDRYQASKRRLEREYEKEEAQKRDQEDLGVGDYE